MKMSALMAENSNSFSHFVDIVYSCFLIMYCIVLYLLCIMSVFNLLSVYQCINKGYQK